MQKELAYQQYRRTQIQTSDPGDLLLMLYQGGLKFSKLALEAMQQKDIEKTHNNIVKTQDIIMELSTTLNFEAGGEIAENLERLYDYMYRRLTEANVKKAVEPLEEVIQMLTDLYETWAQVVQQAKGKARPHA